VFGPRRLMMAGSVVMAAGLLLTSQVNQWWQLYLSFGVLSVCLTDTSPQWPTPLSFGMS